MSGYYIRNAAGAIGKKFGKLTIVEMLKERTKDRKIVVKCLCDCGKEHTVALTLLKQNLVNSCGCVKPEIARQNGRLAVAKLLESGKYRKPSLSSAWDIYSHYSDGDILFDEFLVLTKQNCFYCGCEPHSIANRYCSLSRRHRYSSQRLADGDYIYNGLDRIDNNIGHLKSNIVPCCKECNWAKGKRSKDDFLSWIERVYSFQKKVNNVKDS